MIKLCVPFLLTDQKQIPESLIQKRGLSLEANIFDGNELKALVKKNKFSKLLSDAMRIAPVRAFHFPVENADYLESITLSQLLYKTIEIISQNRIPYLILHSNHIRSAKTFDHSDLPQIRKKYISYYHALGNFAHKHKVTICIENLPIIGNEGSDFDSVFVFPRDFLKLSGSGLKIAWDLGHWAYTYDVHKTVAKKFEKVLNAPDDFLKFLKLKNIAHCHFSSYKKITLLKCEEGVIPQSGDFSQNYLIQACRAINDWPGQTGMTLEIKEKDYHRRTNLINTLEWFDSKVFSHANKLEKGRLQRPIGP